MIYLDFSATSPLLPEVKQKMTEVMSMELGNPSSLHSAGSSAKTELTKARSQVAQLIEVPPLSVIFTSGGSESNNTVIHTFSDCPILVSAIEHPSVLQPATVYGSPCLQIPVNRQGIIDLAGLKQSLHQAIAKHPKQKILVSVMLANNEVGTIEPISDIAKIIQGLKQTTGAKIFLHTDATQAVGKIPVSAKDLGVDYLTFTSHKLGGPVGLAALYVKPGSPFKPLILGGAQENKRRAGTSNVLLASGFGVACEIAKKNIAKYKKVEELRNYLEKEILDRIPSAKIITPIGASYSVICPIPQPPAVKTTTSSRNEYRKVPDGVPTERCSFDDCEARTRTKTECEATALPNILNVSFPAAEGESTQLYLDLEGIEVSTGSACASGDLEPSHVLMAMYHDAEIAHGSVRFSLGLSTTKAEIDQLLAKLPGIIAKIQDLSTIKQGKS